VQDAQRLVRAGGGSPQAVARLSELAPEPATRRFVENMLRRLQALREQGRYLPEENFYPGLALLGRRDEALRALEHAAEERSYYLIVNVAAEPALDSLRAEPRFLALRQRLGLDSER
jgi:type II secretory pathway predicted ATPase ExeA